MFLATFHQPHLHLPPSHGYRWVHSGSCHSHLLWVRLGSCHSRHLEWLFHRELPVFWHNRPLLPILYKLPEGRNHVSVLSLSPWFSGRLPGNERAIKRCMMNELTFQSTALTAPVSNLTAQMSAYLMREWAPRGRGLLLIHLCILSTWHTVFRKCGGRR